MKTVCTARLAELRTPASAASAAAAVDSEISILLSGKTLTELEMLEGNVRAKLASGEPVDTDYWEGLLKNLNVWKAKVRRKTGSSFLGFFCFVYLQRRTD